MAKPPSNNCYIFFHNIHWITLVYALLSWVFPNHLPITGTSKKFRGASEASWHQVGPVINQFRRRVTPKWMVKIMEKSYEKMGWFGRFPHDFWKRPFIQLMVRKSGEKTSWWQVNIPSFTMGFSTIPGGCLGFLPSTVGLYITPSYLFKSRIISEPLPQSRRTTPVKPILFIRTFIRGPITPDRWNSPWRNYTETLNVWYIYLNYTWLISMINVGKYILHYIECLGIVISCCFILCLNNCSYPEARHHNSWCPSIQHVAPRCHADVLFVEMHIAGLPKGLASPLLKMTPFLENTRAFTKTYQNVNKQPYVVW